MTRCIFKMTKRDQLEAKFTTDKTDRAGMIKDN